MEYTRQQQKNTNWCGAACLSMIYDYYYKSYEQARIYRDLKISPEQALYSVNIARHVNENHTKLDLTASVVRVIEDKIKEFFDFIQENECHLVMSHRAKNSTTSHFTLFCEMNDIRIHGEDPFNKDNYPITIDEIKELWKSQKIQPISVTGYIGIVISDDNSLFKTVTCSHCNALFPKIFHSSIKESICPHCDKECP